MIYNDNTMCNNTNTNNDKDYNDNNDYNSSNKHDNASISRRLGAPAVRRSRLFSGTDR